SLPATSGRVVTPESRGQRRRWGQSWRPPARWAMQRTAGRGDPVAGSTDEAPPREVTDMAERTLRGSRLGAISYETDRNAELAPRQEGSYRCPHGHDFTVPFAADAEIPLMWECQRHGDVGRLIDGAEPETKKAKPARTHW